MSSLRPDTAHQVDQSLASQWLDPSSLPEGVSVTEALKKIHDNMTESDMKVAKVTEGHT